MFRTPRRELLPDYSLLVAGERAAGGGGGFEHIYPATGESTSQIRLASSADVDAAVGAARAAFPAWRALAGDRRRDLMFKLAALIEAATQDLAHLSTVDNGSVCVTGPYVALDAAQKFRYFGGWADKIQGRTVSTWGGPAHDYVAFEPYGVVGAIVPWNGPLFAATMVIAPALAAGNCVVLKAPDIAPYAVLMLGRLVVEAGFPKGVVNIVTGGAPVGEAMVAHPGIDKIQFVGSGAVAKKVLKSAADTLKPCALELGGKSAVIVFADADLQEAARRGLSGAVSANGQGCVNGTRVLVERSIYAPYLELLSAMAARVKIGDPLDPGTNLGPVISEASLERIVGIVDAAVARDGARLVTGGSRLRGDLAAGYFLPITIVADAPATSAIARTEVFGPVLTVMPFDDEAGAVAAANATEYGLGAYVHTQNVARAHDVAARLDAGMIQVNGSGEAMTPCVPFGGMKQSGHGRVGGEEGLHEFLRVKNVWVNLARNPAAR